jgi:hypothetical protein
MFSSHIRFDLEDGSKLDSSMMCDVGRRPLRKLSRIYIALLV